MSAVPAAIAAAPDRTFAPAGSGAGQLRPHATLLAVSASGDVYAGNTADGEIEVFAHDGTPLTRADAPGLRALAMDGDRLVVVTEPGVTAAAISADKLLTARGDGVYAGDDRISDLAGVNGLAVAADGDVFATTPERVHRLSASGAAEAEWPAADARGVAVAPDGSVLVAQGTLHRIGVYSPDGALRDTHEGMNVISAVAADCRGNVFALDNSDPRGHVIGDAGAPPCPVPTPSPTPAPSPSPTPEPQGAVLAEVVEAGPELGRTQRATVREGKVYVGKGADRRLLSQRALLPVGSSFDTTEGTLKLEFETRRGPDRDRFGRYMEGEFSDGEFTTHQSTADSLVELHLEGSGVGASTSAAQAAAKRKRRSVWSTAKGKFRTVGRHGAATVRGTRWFTEDRDDGTFFSVAEGTVAVKDFRTGRTRILEEGETFLARAACLSRRRFWITLQVPVGARVVGAEVHLAGKRLPLRIGRRARALVDLRGRPRGRVAVRIRARLADGRTLVGTRTYMTCAGKRADGDGPPL